MPTSKRTRSDVPVAALGAIELRIAALERMLVHNDQTHAVLLRLPATDGREDLLQTNRASGLRLKAELEAARAERKRLA
jgi:hypothetical protein